MFSSGKNKFQVDKQGLKSWTIEKIGKGLQDRDGNRIAGLEGRTNVLIRLGDAMDQNPEFFGSDGRPGNMLGEFLVPHMSEPLQLYW